MINKTGGGGGGNKFSGALSRVVGLRSYHVRLLRELRRALTRAF